MEDHTKDKVMKLMIRQKDLQLVLKGMAMGLAEVIPGVSGGTIAFITGIYETLIHTIKGVNLSLFTVLKKEGFGAFWKSLNGRFLLFLLVGMFSGLVVGIFLIGYLLRNYQAPLWAFFFGLIIASAIYIGKQVGRWDVTSAGLLFFGMIAAYGVTLFSPAEGSANLVVVFFSGVIAISALILPGISGSFILLLLGMYTIIRNQAELALTTFQGSSILILVVFGLGCLIGLGSFARVLSYAFKNFKDRTLALLTGFMLGSLNKIWPWRNPVSWLDKTTGKLESDLTLMSRELLLSDHIQLISETKVWPSAYLYFEAQLLLSILSFISGLLIVYLLDRK